MSKLMSQHRACECCGVYEFTPEGRCYDCALECDGHEHCRREVSESSVEAARLSALEMKVGL